MFPVNSTRLRALAIGMFLTAAEDLKAMFVYAPDTKITEHSVRIGSGEWTSVIGVMKGTFTKPMPVAGGKMIAPTGKSFKLTMCRVDH
jgi:hypothetical protein